VEQRFNKIIVVIFLTNIGFVASAQISANIPVYTIQSSVKKSFKQPAFHSFGQGEINIKSNPNFQQTTFNTSSASMIRPDFYTKNFGFFCRQELQIEKYTKLPLRFRLGSLQECNRLENK
jgi:hypothetical protein